MSGGQTILRQPCSAYQEPKEVAAKKATIIRMRKYAQNTNEERRITIAKIKTIREHDLSKGIIAKCLFDDRYYIFPIKVTYKQ